MKLIHAITTKIDSLFNIGESSRFRKNFLKVLRASLLAQIIPLLSTPLLTRLYSPDEFGIIVLLISLLGSLLTFSTWRVEWAIPNAENDQEEISLIFIGLGFLAISCVLSIFLIYVSLTILFKETQLVLLLPYLPIITVALAGLGITQVLTGSSIRHADMHPVSIAVVFRTTVVVLSSIALGVQGLTQLGLIIANVLGFWAETITLVRLSTINLFLVMRARLKEVFKVWKKYRSECSVSVAVGIVNYGFITLLPLSLAATYSVKEVGYYAIANKVAIAPVSLISKAVSQSFWAESSKLAKENPFLLRKVYKQTLFRLLALSILPMLGCLSGPVYMGTIFGQTSWADAGVLLAAMTPQVIGTFIFGSTNHLTVYSKQKYQLLSDFMTIIFSLAWLRLAIAIKIGFVITLTGISSITLFGYILRFAFHLKANKDYIDEFNSI